MCSWLPLPPFTYQGAACGQDLLTPQERGQPAAEQDRSNAAKLDPAWQLDETRPKLCDRVRYQRQRAELDITARVRPHKQTSTTARTLSALAISPAAAFADQLNAAAALSNRVEREPVR